MFRALALCFLSTGFVLAEVAPPLVLARKAARFFHEQVGEQGCYLWHYSGDLTLREAEGIPPRFVGWVQAPGTPAIGQAYLDAWLATQEADYLIYAEACALALVRGQLQSGGWDHSFDLDAERRKGGGYRGEKMPKKPRAVTSLDDDISTSALRFLMGFDRATKSKHAAIGEAVRYGLSALLAAQYPNGAWYQWWRTVPKAVAAEEFPVLPASYPDAWSRQWDNQWTGRYFLNDGVVVNAMTTLLLAHELYGDAGYLVAAKRAGDFLLLAQMPDPQPAWAQQYNPAMQPVWDRKFEPPAISSRESERVLLGLIRLYHATGDVKYLAPQDRAIAYLKTCVLADGQVPRFLELRSNKPLYFEVIGKAYHLTYDDRKLPKHYGFKVSSILSYVEAQLALARKARDAGGWYVVEPAEEVLPTVAEVSASLDSRGAWVANGRGMDMHEVTPASGVISCATFIRNLHVLISAVR
jgi:Pectic acid lyase